MRQRAEELGGRWLVAERLVISPKTVRKHISSIFSKLQMTSRLEAIMRAKDAGMS